MRGHRVCGRTTAAVTQRVPAHRAPGRHPVSPAERRPCQVLDSRLRRRKTSGLGARPDGFSDRVLDLGWPSVWVRIAPRPVRWHSLERR